MGSPFICAEVLSTNRIAAVAGVSIGSLYQYFPSKEALVAALIERHANELIQVIESKLASLANAPLEVALRELMRASRDAHRIDPKLHKVLVEQIPRVGQLERVTDVERHLTQLIYAYLEARQDQIRPKNLHLAAFIVEQVIEALTHAAVINHSDFWVDSQMEQEVTDLLLRYLACERATKDAAV